MGCHLLFAVPAIGLLLFWVPAWPVALPTYLLVVGLTALILVPTFRTMRGRVTTGAEGMVVTFTSVALRPAPCAFRPRAVK